MADFSYLAVAVMRAIGLDEKQFLDLYKHNVQEVIATCVINDPLITCVKYLLNEKDGEVKMPAKELWTELGRIAQKHHITLGEYSSSSLSRALGKKEADLKSIGIDFSREKSAQRAIILSQSKTDFTPQTPPLPECGGDYELDLDD